MSVGPPPAMASASPLAEELTPAPDPWAVARRLAHLPHLLFLDSADRHPDRGRYSYVMAEPVWFNYCNATPADVWSPFHTLDLGQMELEDEGRPTIPGLPPFQGGVAGVFGYGISRES